MNVRVQFETQLKRAAGRAEETLDVPDSATVAEVVRTAAQRHGGSVASILLDPDQNVRPSVLIFLGDEQVGGDDPRPLTEGTTLTLMSPISGG